MTPDPRFLPSCRQVLVWIPPGSQIIGTIGLIEAFDAANRVLSSNGRPPLYAVDVVGDGPTPTAAGARLATAPVDEAADVHTLVLAGSLDDADLPLSPAHRRALAPLANRAQRLVSVCAGAFALGDLGHLDGRRCTTHWLALQRLRDRFPTARVQDDAIHTEDGPVYTSAGASAGIDLALHLIHLDGGRRLALTVAQLLVVFAQRSGGQSQFGSRLRVRPGVEDRLQTLMAAVLRSPGQDHGVVRMAKAVGMSPRHFARVFAEQTGLTPAAFVSRVRVEAAQRALLQSDASLDEVATDCGFGTAETMRRSFHREVGVGPSDYRRHFRAGPSAAEGTE